MQNAPNPTPLGPPPLLADWDLTLLRVIPIGDAVIEVKVFEDLRAARERQLISRMLERGSL